MFGHYRFSALAALAILSGCAMQNTAEHEKRTIIRGGLIPHTITVELSHDSHISVGKLNCHGRCNEDSLTVFSVIAGWEPAKGLTISLGEGINLNGRNGGGFYGPGEVFTGRVAYTFNLN